MIGKTSSISVSRLSSNDLEGPLLKSISPISIRDLCWPLSSIWSSLPVDKLVLTNDSAMCCDKFVDASTGVKS